MFPCRRRPGWDGEEAGLEAACGCGCNPHCHFLLLLQSISFDHSILLDFLISTETCFLEYFVRYLRFLRSDPQGFAAACRRIDAADCHVPKQWIDAPAEAEVERSAEKIRLVDYPSSDESDLDEKDPQGQSRTSAFEKARSTTDTVNDQVSESSYLAQGRTERTAERRRGRFSLEAGRERREGPSSWKLTDGQTLDRTVDCLSHLRQVVTRLQAKKLFPYNPSSLLKLLAQVDSCLPSTP